MNMAVESKEIPPDDFGNPKPTKKIAGNLHGISIYTDNIDLEF